MVETETVRAAARRRTREMRDRHAAGLLCVTVEMHLREVGALVAGGLLPPDRSADRQAIAVAMATLLDRVPLSRFIELASTASNVVQG
jgi:hypothetical protein